MDRQLRRRACLDLVEACLGRLLGMEAQQASETVARLARSRRLARLEHQEAFYVAYELAHPGADSLTLNAMADALLASQRDLYEQLMVETGYLPSPADHSAEPELRRRTA